MTGGVHASMAAANSGYPYLLVVSLGSRGAHGNSGEFYMQDRSYRFICYAVSDETLTGKQIAGTTIERVATIFTAKLSTNMLTLSTEKVMSVYRGPDVPILEPGRTENGREVWKWMLDLTFMVQRQY